MGLAEIQALKENAGKPKQKPVYQLRKVSEKKQKQLDEEKKQRLPDEDSAMESYFKAMRKKMVGICQCGCSLKSSKHEDQFFRNSICHVFPKSKFPSVMYHPLNWVERNFWDGHHTNMDNRSIELWVNFADWNDIRERFFELAPLLTDEERANKFYSNLEKLVYENK